MKNATELRTLVIENQFELGRLSAETLGREDYNALTALYQTALDTITLWANREARHTAEEDHSKNAFDAVKAILNLYTTEDNRIIIDTASLNSIRDRATKPKTVCSKAYKDADKARKNAEKTLEDRIKDLEKLGAPERTEEQNPTQWVDAIHALGIVTLNDKTGIDTASLYLQAVATLETRKAELEAVKTAGKWHWREVVPVDLSVFADLVEGYIADCLTEGFNLKSSADIRAERAARRAERKSK